MRIGLIDCDSHNFPNLALMKISAYHKSKGDAVEWWWSDFEHYDIVYKSKVFSDSYSPDTPDPMNADKIIRGGTGYAISLTADGREVFDPSKHEDLPAEIEKCFPDYSIYPQYEYAVSMTSRGCPRGCAFCHVQAKEGCKSHKCADVSDFWCGQKEIKVLDPNITACREKRDLLSQYVETGAIIDFTQGIDIRLLNEEDIEDLNRMRIKNIHFAWDNPAEDLTKHFEYYRKQAKHKPHGSYGTVYLLTNFEGCSTEEHVERAIQRIKILDSIGYDPFVMIYNKPNAPKVLWRLQQWCNNKRVFRAVKDFADYDRRRIREQRHNLA